MMKSFLKKFVNRWLSDPIILFIALFNVAIHYAVSGNLEYHRDEMLYLSLGMHPAAGYATVPPMIGWVSWLIQNLFGFSIYAVRIMPAVLSGVMILLVAGIARELGGKRYATILAAVGFSISGFGLRSFALFMPVCIDVFFWTLCLYLILKYVNSQEDRYLIMFGIASGLALLNKYLIGILFAGLLLIVPFTPYRNIFSKKKFLVAVLCGLIVFLPNLAWQAAKGFPVFGHLAELNRTQLVNVDRVGFLLEQFMMAAWASFLLVAGLVQLLFIKKASRYRFFGLLALFVIFSLMLLRGKSYYTIGVFPFLFAAGAVNWEETLKKTWMKWGFPILLVLVALPSLPMALPVMKSKGLVRYFSQLEKKYGIVVGRRFEDNSIHSLPQDYADMIGWEQLTRVADSAWQMIDDKNAAFIYGENYGQAAAITVIGRKYNLPGAVCFSESFRYWFPKEFNPDIKAVVYINSSGPGQDVKDLFRKITRIGGITDPNAREYGTSVYLCEDPVSGFNEFWKRRTKDLLIYR